MQQVLHRTARQRVSSDPAAATLGEEGGAIDPSPPPRYDRPFTVANVVATSPVTNARLANDQEMQSGADALSGVADSDRSGRDYSREQSVGRAPGWRWPWNQRSEAYDITSLDRWMVERSGAVNLPAHIDAGGLTLALNPYEAPYRDVIPSPITAMDQLTTYYENDPDQWYYFSPPPMTIADVRAPNFTEQAQLF